ncbi:MAG TPA: hypothetical protein VFE60_24285 [Roseiarcus sp.]|jgi:hypothetical protein|nr:hypothetical protein [Roseiarcus sp.]
MAASPGFAARGAGRRSHADCRITSLAFNLAGVDVMPDMGPFEIVPGTQWDDGRAWKYEMFPPEDGWLRFAERGVRKFCPAYESAFASRRMTSL